MKKRLLSIVLAGILVCMSSAAVFADKEEKKEEKKEVEMVDVAAIDLSLHSETTGDFTSIYNFENPFKGKDTSKGAVIEFYAQPTWEVHALGAIFCIMGEKEYDGRLYFSPGSYLGFNSDKFGGYYDANLYNYNLVTDYIKNGALIRIELLPDGFKVFANDELCYDQTILEDTTKAAGDYKVDSDFKPVLEWLAGAQNLHFGANSWWNAVGGNEANINLSKVSFRLMDGTVLFDQLQADKKLLETLGATPITELDDSAGGIEIKDVKVDVFDINSVEYKGMNIIPIMVIAVIIVAVGAAGITVVVTRKRTYDEV